MIEPVLRGIIHRYHTRLAVARRWRTTSDSLHTVYRLHVPNHIRILDKQRRRRRRQHFELQPRNGRGAGGVVLGRWSGIDFVAKGDAVVGLRIVEVEGGGFGVGGEVVVAGGVGAGGAVQDGGAIEGGVVGEAGEVVEGDLVGGGDAGCIE